MNERTMKTLPQRLDRVERENRRLKKAVVGVLALSLLLVGLASAQQRHDSKGRFDALATAYRKHFGPLAVQLETQGRKAILTVSDQWYSLKPHEKERIKQVAVREFALISVQHGFPQKGFYLVRFVDTRGKILDREATEIRPRK